MLARIDGMTVVEYPVEDIRTRFPEKSFPAILRDEDLPEGYVEVAPTDRPSYNKDSYKVVLGAPQFTGDRWVQVWDIIPLTDAEIEERMNALKDAITRAAQQRLDRFAASKGYDSMLSACTYASSSVERFRVDGQYCVSARDATWARLYEILEEVLAGTRPVPAGYADIEGELPALVWPT